MTAALPVMLDKLLKHLLAFVMSVDPQHVLLLVGFMS